MNPNCGNCGNCEYAHAGPMANILDCHLHPPKVFMAMGQGVGGPQPIGISMRPSVGKNDAACSFYSQGLKPDLKTVA